MLVVCDGAASVFLFFEAGTKGYRLIGGIWDFLSFVGGPFLCETVREMGLGAVLLLWLWIFTGGWVGWL